MTEYKLRGIVIGLLKTIGAFAVENPACPGTPDICATRGWIELKIGAFPVRNTSPVKVKVRNEQRIWLRRWARVGGKAWTITLVGHEWYLHDGLWSSDFLGKVNEFEFSVNAKQIWGGRPSAIQLIGELK